MRTLAAQLTPKEKRHHRAQFFKILNAKHRAYPPLRPNSFLHFPQTPHFIPQGNNVNLQHFQQIMHFHSQTMLLHTQTMLLYSQTMQQYSQAVLQGKIPVPNYGYSASGSSPGFDSQQLWQGNNHAPPYGFNTSESAPGYGGQPVVPQSFASPQPFVPQPKPSTSVGAIPFNWRPSQARPNAEPAAGVTQHSHAPSANRHIITYTLMIPRLWNYSRQSYLRR